MNCLKNASKIILVRNGFLSCSTPALRTKSLLWKIANRGNISYTKHSVQEGLAYRILLLSLKCSLIKTPRRQCNDFSIFVRYLWSFLLPNERLFEGINSRFDVFPIDHVQGNLCRWNRGTDKGRPLIIHNDSKALKSGAQSDDVNFCTKRKTFK